MKEALKNLKCKIEVESKDQAEEVVLAVVQAGGSDLYVREDLEEDRVRYLFVGNLAKGRLSWGPAEGPEYFQDHEATEMSVQEVIDLLSNDPDAQAETPEPSLPGNVIKQLNGLRETYRNLCDICDNQRLFLEHKKIERDIARDAYEAAKKSAKNAANK